MQLLVELERKPGVPHSGRIIRREAVRGIIRQGNHLLMVYSARNGDYKFPGGGIEKGESHLDALARELREECGAQLLHIDGELGIVIESDRAGEPDFDRFEMTSYYYYCNIAPELGETCLDSYEKELGFAPVWVEMETAVRANEAVLVARIRPPRWTRRETYVLRKLLTGE